MYTIGQVSEMFRIPISTLRYYDKEGFSQILNEAVTSGNSAITSLFHLSS